MSGAILRYRVMAYIVGVMLIILVCVAVPLQFAAGKPQLEEIVGPMHGFLYMIYLVAAADLARRAKFTLLQMAAMVGAGLIPTLAFFVERRITKGVVPRAPAAAAQPEPATAATAE